MKLLRLLYTIACVLFAAPMLFAQAPAKDAPPAAAAAPTTPVRRLASWTSDRHEYAVGDVITVTVTEATLATATKSQSGSDAQSRKNDLDLEPPKLGTSALPSITATLGTNKGATSAQAGDAKRGVNFKGNISVQVVAVDKTTGNVQIKGTKVVDLDKNKQTLNFSGWVRPQDVTPDNLVISDRVANASLTYELTGEIGKTRGGLLGRLLNTFWP